MGWFGSNNTNENLLTESYTENVEKSMDRENEVKLFQVAITYTCNKNCDYCFAKSLRGIYDEMTLEDFKDLLNWMERNKIKSFNFTGGEPTLHQKIREFLEMAHSKGFNIGMFSNGLFPEYLLDAIENVNSFLINYNPENHYTKKEYELLQHNLENISKRNIKLALMCCITDKIHSCDYILKACKEYGISEVLLDFVIPDSLKSNCFIEHREFQKKKELLLGFIEKLREEKINVKISRPMPRCIFSKEELENLNNSVYFECGSGRSIITVNPDLTTFPCLPLFFRGPKITSFTNVSEFKEFYRKSIGNLKWKKTLYKKCKSCLYFFRKNCQGACLCHKCKRFNILERDSFVIYSQYKIRNIKEFIRSVDRSIHILNKMFGKMSKKINIFLFDKKDDMLYYSGVYFYPKWVNGFVAYPLSYFTCSKNRNRILHELCHLYIKNFAKSKIPDWLNEGFCEFITFNDNTKKLKELAKKKELVPFEKMSDCGLRGLLKYDNDPLDSNICYNQSCNLVSYLVKVFGLKKVMLLINDRYEDFYKHFFDVVGKEFSEVEKEWLETHDLQC